MKLKPLSAFNYCINNKKRMIPAALCVALCVFFIYIFSLYAGATFAADKTLLNIRKSLSYVYAMKDSRKINDDLIRKISADPSTERIIQCGTDYTNYNMPMGGDAIIMVFKVSDEDMKYLLKKMKLQLKAGNLPRGKDEILIHERLAVSKKLNVGDMTGQDPEAKEVLNGSYKVAGIIQGEAIVSFIPVNNINSERYKSLLVIHKEGMMEASNEFLMKEVKNSDIDTLTYKAALQEQNADDSQMGMVLNITQVIVVIVMTLAIVNLNYVHIYHRRKEFGILHALGYSRKLVVKRILGEFALLQSCGYSLGIILAVITGFILKYNLFDRKGLSFEVIGVQPFMQTIVVPVFICIFNILPVWRMLKKLDSISIVQGNE